MSLRCILHVDMDAFFASVEQRDHPEWRGRPVIVGAGPTERGVVSTCSYEARKFGVHSAMPSRTAFAHCPQGIFVKPRMRAYKAASDEVFAIFARFSPFLEKVSVDEAFMDITGSAHLFGGAIKLAEQLRKAVRDETQLTCSVGLASNRLLAKIASDMRKPDGLFVMPFDEQKILNFLAPRPLGILWGAGKKTVEVLVKYGIKTCGDVQRADIRFLRLKLGDAAADNIYAHAFGRDATLVESEAAVEKSVSREYTFPHDENRRDEVRARLLELVEEVGRRFRADPARRACTAKLKFRDALFNTITRQSRFELAARDDITFREKALEIFDNEWPHGTERIIRLIGFGVTDFSENPPLMQGSLFAGALEAKLKKRERLAEAVDRIRKFTNKEKEDGD